MIPLIAVANKSSLVSARDFGLMLRACQAQLDRDVCPEWGWMRTRLLEIDPDTMSIDAPVVIVKDKSDVDGAAGYHDEDELGRERGFVFAVDVLKYGTMLDGPDAVSAVLSHELIELLGDPFCTRWEDGPKISQGSMYAFELADPTQGGAYPIEVDGVKVSVSNFVLPAWFDGDEVAKRKVDHLGLCPGAFQLAPGGYMIVRGSHGEHSIFGAVPPSDRVLAKLRARAGRTGKRGAGAP